MGSPTFSGSDTAPANGVYTLGLSAAGVGTIDHWTIDWGDGTTGSPDIQTVSGNPQSVTHVYANDSSAPLNHAISATVTDTSDNTYTAVQTQLDDTFGIAGRVTTDLGSGGSDELSSMVVQPDGKIIVAGTSAIADWQFALVRYNSDGSLDTSFGNDGVVYTHVDGHDWGHYLALQPNGDILLGGICAGGSGFSFGVVRYNPDGSLDTSFGTDGLATDTFSGAWGDGANAIALQPDGKIVAVGTGTTSSGSQDFAVVRFNSDGTLDTTFGTDGAALTDVAGNGSNTALAVSVLDDGDLIVSGRANAFEMACYTPDGALDTTFGADGIDYTNTGDFWDRIDSIAYDPVTNTIVAAGEAYDWSRGSGSEFCLARYNASTGALDTTFGGTGVVYTDFAADDQADCVTFDNQGRILASGFSQLSDGSWDLSLARYNTDGSLDTTFGAGGKLLVPDGSFGWNSNPTVAVLPDDEILLAGTVLPLVTSGDSGNQNFGLVQINPDNIDAVTVGVGPAAPTGLAGNPASAETVNLTWDLDTTGTVDHYNLYRSTTADFTPDPTPDTGNQVDSFIPATDAGGGQVAYTDAGLEPGQTYYYEVTAVDSSGNESQPDGPVEVDMPALDVQPTGIAAVSGQVFSGVVATFTDVTPSVSGYTASINWGDGSDPSDATVTDNGDGTFSVSASYTYAHAAHDSYSVTVTASDDGRTATASGDADVAYSTVTSTPDAPTDQPPAPSISATSTDLTEGDAFTLNLASNASSVDPVTEWDVSYGDGNAPQQVSGDPGSDTYTYDSGAGVYEVSASATDADGFTYDATGGMEVDVVPKAPTDVAVSDDTDLLSDTAINLTWTNNSQIAMGYKVYYGTSAGIENQQPYLTNPGDSTTNILPADATSCEVSGLNPGTTYYFTVVATNAAGDSEQGTTSGTTQASDFTPDTLVGSLGLDELNSAGYNDPAGTLADIDLVQDYQNGVPEAGKLLAVDDGTGPAVPMTPAIVNDGNPGSDPSSIDAVFTFPSWLQLSTAPTGGTAITSGTPIQFSDLTPVDATNQPGVYRIYLKADAPSTADQTITLDEILDPSAGGSGSSGSPATLPATQTAVADGIQATVTQLSYGSYAPTATGNSLFHTILRDNGSGAYSSIEWKGDASGKVLTDNDFPIAYTMSGTVQGQDFMTIQAKMTVHGLASGVNYQIRAVTMGNDDFGATPTILVQQGNAAVSANTLSATVQSLVPVASMVMKTNIVLKWQIAVAGSNDWVDVNGGETTSTRTYLMRGNPVTPQYETVVDIGCRDAAGDATATAALRDIWNDFNEFGHGHGVRNAAGQIMTYYGDPSSGYPNVPYETTMACLLANHDGRCGGWADLFRSVLEDQGIDAKVVTITPGTIIPDPDGNIAAFNGLSITTSLVIKPTLAGQGTDAPARSVFNDHAVVELTGLDVAGGWFRPELSPNVIYDPSYGRAYSGSSLANSEQMWRDAAEQAERFEFERTIATPPGIVIPPPDDKAHVVGAMDSVFN